MTNRSLLQIGATGSAITALCCFTPALVILLGVLGAGAAVGWLDYLLLPALSGFLGLTGYALWKRRQA